MLAAKLIKLMAKYKAIAPHWATVRYVLQRISTTQMLPSPHPETFNRQIHV
jgi:hypothetical protein